MLLELNLQNILVLLTIQFAVFGWRINREIVVGDQGRRTWFPIPDIVNVLSIVGVLAAAVIWPLAASHPSPSGVFRFPLAARAAFSAGFVLLVFHPLAMVAHYGLLNRDGRSGFLKKGKTDYPYFPVQERVVVAVALATAAAAAYVTR